MGRGSSGPITDHVFSIEGDRLEGHELRVRPDPVAPSVHAFIEPARRMLVDVFQAALAATRLGWTRAWP